jgi:Na+/proline symporter
MSIIVIISLLLALSVYVGVGLFLGRKTKNVADMLPLTFNRQARVASSSEFSSSTVATTISLATVVMAFFELAQKQGIWLLWTVVTTSTGLLLVRFFAKRIWNRISVYDHRPTLHEFLGSEYRSEPLRYVGAVCTSLGFLCAFAVELTVGTKFFAAMVPGVPSWTVILVLTVVAFMYTAIGGFRAVIVTDRIQMFSIWLLLFSLPLFYMYFIFTHGGWCENFAKIPAGTLDFSYREGLFAFLLGIFVINVPTFISDMSIWQRIAGAQEDKIVSTGLLRSVFSSATTWGIFALLACFSFMIVNGNNDTNPLLGVIHIIQGTKGRLALMVLFLTVLGLYGAMLSTASTQLIAVSHTVYADVFSRIREHPSKERIESRKELNISRTILVLAAIVSTILVQLLESAGLSITDLVFAVYGPQLALCPLVITALLCKRERLSSLSAWAALAVTVGFITGWGSAVYGGLTDNSTWVFMSPVLSLIASSTLLYVGFLVDKFVK